MEPSPETREFAILLRRPNEALTDRHSDETRRTVVRDYFAWFDELEERGVLVSRRALAAETLRVASGEVVDGPFVETKEIVLGFVLLRVASLDEAVAIAKTCPGLRIGDTAEVREVRVVRRE